MIKEIKILLDKYKKMQGQFEYVPITQVVQDIYNLLQDARIKRLPKGER